MALHLSVRCDVTRTLLLSVGLLATGCVTARPPAVAEKPAPPQYVEASASALAFDPPLDMGVPHPELARAPRQPSVFLGFDESTTELYIRATNDLQTNDFGDFYTQQSFSVKSGTRYH
jgi:hypothetical protein